MSLNSLIGAGLSGLQTAETQLRVVSDNVSNVDTSGYIRKIAEQTPTASNGVGTGVNIASIKLAADQYLQQASLTASAAQGAASASSQLLDQVQGLFGDPAGTTGLFADINTAFGVMASGATNPNSGPQRQEIISGVSQVLSDSAQIALGVQSVRAAADGQIGAAVNTINGLLQQIDALNGQISRTSVAGGDATGAQTQQSQLLDQLSSLIDVKVSGRTAGGVNVRTSDGLLLAGAGAATLSYSPAGTVTPQTQFAQILVTPAGGAALPLTDHLVSGQLKGLLNVRDVAAPAIADQIGELTSQFVDRLNAAHNASSAVPAPASLTGKTTGQDLPTAISGFTGKTNVAIVDASGVIQTKVAIDFSTGSMSANGAGPVSFSPSTFLSTLNTCLGASGQASFSATGSLSISAKSGAGVVVADDTTAPSANAGRGFSWYFGLNDLVTSNTVATYQTGLSGPDPSGFAPGQTITFGLSSPSGAHLTDLSVTVPSSGPGTMDALLGALNSPTSGLGQYGGFSLDPQGQLSFRGLTSPSPTLSIVNDATSRHGPDGPSFSAFFGVGEGVRASRATSFQVRPDIAQNASGLALAQLDLSAPGGSPALLAGDGRGAQALADASQKSAQIGATRGAGPMTMSLNAYVSAVAGDVGARASLADSQAKNAQALLTSAQSSRSAKEGVNLDEELVKLTTFQQAYNASGRLIQSAKEMYDTLLGLIT